MVFPATLPPYGFQGLVDSEGYVWVGHHKLSGHPAPDEWSVFAPDGHLLGVISTPERLQVRQIGSDYVLGVWTDELDVRHVRMYPLVRGTADRT